MAARPGRLPDRPQHRLGVVDVDEAVEGDAEDSDGLLAVDHRDHARPAPPLEGGERPPPRRSERTLRRPRARRRERGAGRRSRSRRRCRGRCRRGYGGAAASIRAMDGVLDWYVLGVVFGLGVAAGAARLSLRCGLPLWARSPSLAAVGALVARAALAPVVDDRRRSPARSSSASSRSGRLSAEALPAAVLAAVVARGDPAARLPRRGGGADRRRPPAAGAPTRATPASSILAKD